MSKENMIRMGKEAGYGWKEFEYDLWKRQVAEKLFVCCFEVGFIRMDPSTGVPAHLVSVMAAGSTAVSSKAPETKPDIPSTTATTTATAVTTTTATAVGSVDVTSMSDEDVLLRIAVGEMEYTCKNLKTIGPKGADGGWDGESLC
jgi:hypothetical protein